MEQHPEVIDGWRPGAWFLMDSWRHHLGLPPKFEPKLKPLPLSEQFILTGQPGARRPAQRAALDSLNRTEISPAFIGKVNRRIGKKGGMSVRFFELLRARMVMGFFRHGFFGDPKKPQFARTKDCRRRLELFHRSGNTEHLIDAFNTLMLEWVEGDNPHRYDQPLCKPSPLHKLFRRDCWDPWARQAHSYVRAYEEFFNREFLVAAAARIAQEFARGHHPNKHFAASDDGVHASLKNP